MGQHTDMGLSSEVHDGVDFVRLHHIHDQIRRQDITLCEITNATSCEEHGSGRTKHETERGFRPFRQAQTQQKSTNVLNQRTDLVP
jgi:hypothetical protein